MKKISLVMIIMVVLLSGRLSASAQEPTEEQTVPFVPYSIDLSFPELFGGGTFVRELPASDAVSVATAVTDPYGSFYYLISERDAVLANTEVAAWNDLETVTYRFSIYVLTPTGGLLQFCQGTFPLKSYIAGLMFDPANSGRLLVLVRSLAVDEVTCGFLILDKADTTAPATKTRYPTVVSAADSTGSWDLRGLEQCFFEKLSIIQISGRFDVLPQIPAQSLND